MCGAPANTRLFAVGSPLNLLQQKTSCHRPYATVLLSTPILVFPLLLSISSCCAPTYFYPYIKIP